MATFPFDEFVSHIVTMYDVQADSILELYMKIAKYLSDNPIVSEKTVAEIVNKYLEEHPQTGGVTSVNGKTGDITGVYDAQNPPPYPVTKVNNKTGAVTIKSVEGLESSGSYRGGNSSASYPWYQYDYNIDFFKARGYTGATYGKVTESDVCLIPHTLRVLKSTVGAAESRNSSFKRGIRFTSNGLEEIVFKKGNPYNGSATTAIIPGQMVIDKSGQLYSSINPPPYPVTSVNGQTGDVNISELTAGVSSVNGKTGAVTGVYDVDNPPPYPVTSVNGMTGDVNISNLTGGVSSVNGDTGDVTVKRIFSPDGNAHIRQANPDATHTRAFYAESTFNGVKSLISCSFDENDDIHMQVKHGDGSWRDAVLYTTKNPPPSSSSSLSYALVTTETVGESNNRHIVYYDQLPGIADNSINSIISIMPDGQGAYYLRPKYYSDDAFELKVYGDLTDIDYQINVKIIYEV